MADAAEESPDLWLARARALAPAALSAARGAAGFVGRWQAIAAKLECVPPCLSDLSSHPCFAKNALCRELLQSVAAALAEAIDLAGRCHESPPPGKLKMQSDLDALAGRLDINLRDCGLLVKTGVLGDAAVSSCAPTAVPTPGEQHGLAELLARLQIGHAEAKHRALDGLLELLRQDEKSIVAAVSRSSVVALVQLLTATSSKVREKAATVICTIAESGTGDTLLVSEGAVPPLIRLAESGTPVGREKALLALQKLSVSQEAACCIAGHGGIPALIEICLTGDSISQSAATCALKNLSTVPELRQALANEGIIQVMVLLLDGNSVLGCKDYAVECLQNLTSNDDALRRAVVSEGGLRALLVYLDGPVLHESAAAALLNLIGAVSPDSLLSLNVLPRLIRMLKHGSASVQQIAADAIFKISASPEMKRLVAESGCMLCLVRVLEVKSWAAREAAAQALAALLSCPQNRRELKKDDKCVPNLVQLLDPSPQNGAKKHAVPCLLVLAASRRCRRLMVSHGAIGYLKKLTETNVAGAKRLLEKLDRRDLKQIFGLK